MSADYSYPADGLCVGAGEPLWDAFVEGETALARVGRHKRAVTICNRCPVRLPCYKAVNPLKDDGVRGGVVLAAINHRSGFPGYGQAHKGA